MDKLIRSIIAFCIYIIIPIILNKIAPNNNFINIIYYILLIIFYLLLFKKDLINDYKEFKKQKKKNIKVVLKNILFLFFILILSSIFIKLIFNNITDSNSEFLVSALTTNNFYFLFITIVMSPFIEEIVFRKTFKDVISNPWIFIIISSLVFGFYHEGYYLSSANDIIFIVKYFLVGICFSYFYHKTDNFFTPYLTHLIYNAIMAIILVAL